MNINHNELKRKKIVKNGYPNKKVEDNLGKEMQLLEASKDFGRYNAIPRVSYAKVHRLRGEYNRCFGVGLDSRYRLVVEPELQNEKVMQSLSVDITEYFIDYH